LGQYLLLSARQSSLLARTVRSWCRPWYFSPASILVLRMFWLGGSGHAVKSEKAHGRVVGLVEIEHESFIVARLLLDVDEA
jgi:hypothetical protein